MREKKLEVKMFNLVIFLVIKNLYDAKLKPRSDYLSSPINQQIHVTSNDYADC